MTAELENVKTVKDAMASKYWPLFKAAMEDEIKGKLVNAAWEVVLRPTDARVHKSRWVFVVKFGVDRSIDKVKARFVGCGYSMTPDVDYDSIFAATLPGVSFRMLMAWICYRSLRQVSWSNRIL